MENSMSRILIETTVRQTLKGLKEDPKRSIRNLVDMALHFSEGRFQSRFFQTARTMLEHEESAYYAPVSYTHLLFRKSSCSLIAASAAASSCCRSATVFLACSNAAASA